MYIFVPEMSCIVVIAEFELGSLVAACLWQSMTVDCWLAATHLVELAWLCNI